MANILIVDDHPAIRMAVSVLLQRDGHHIFGEIDSGINALSIIKDSPDLVILDIGLPDMDGVKVIQEIRKINSSVCIVVLTEKSSNHMMVRCYQAGADGFVSKNQDLMLLNRAVETCLKGEKYFPLNVIINGKYSADINDEHILKTLSEREMSVLFQLYQGRSNRDIAKDLILSDKTISTYKTRLMQKLQVKNMAELIDVASKFF